MFNLKPGKVLMILKSCSRKGEEVKMVMKLTPFQSFLFEISAWAVHRIYVSFLLIDLFRSF